jgi:tRNA (guanine-N7-)-methyltransferase
MSQSNQAAPGHSSTIPPAAASSASGNTLTSLIVQPRSFFERLDLARLFPSAQPLDVELGSGDGSFLVHYAKTHPELNFLGIERLLGRLRKIDRKGRRLGLTNLRVIRVEAGYFLEYMLPPQSVRDLHIYFPDPWPKRKHRKHRLINTKFAEIAAQVTTPGGAVHLRTDDADYFAQMTAVFRESPHFRQTTPPPELLAIRTDFEADFNARGIQSLVVSYQRT